MKTAPIILMSIGLFVLIKDSQAANPDDVFKTLATEKKNGQQVIPDGGLEEYLVTNGWTSPEGLKAQQVEDAIREWNDKYFISKGKWDAMIRTAAWLLTKNPAEVWDNLRTFEHNVEKIPTEKLDEYMGKTDWKDFSQGMTAKEAANYIARGGTYVEKSEWTATIQMEAFIRNAQ